jgi:hypothetical protein
MKAKIDKERSEAKTRMESGKGEIVGAMCDVLHIGDLELPRLESNEVLGLRIALAALEESTQRHESHLSKIRVQSVLKDLEHWEMLEMIKFHVLQYTVLQEQHILLKMKQPSLCVVPHPMCYGTNLQSEATNSLNHMMVTDCALCCKPFPIHDIIVANYRHLYHPWCALIHFRLHQTCTNAHCPAIMLAAWQKVSGSRRWTCLDFLWRTWIPVRRPVLLRFQLGSKEPSKSIMKLQWLVFIPFYYLLLHYPSSSTIFVLHVY